MALAIRYAASHVHSFYAIFSARRYFCEKSIERELFFLPLSRTLQLAKSSNRLNAFLNDSSGLAARQRRNPISRRKESGETENEDEGGLKFYVTPQNHIIKISLQIQEAIEKKMSEDEDNKDYDPIRAKLMCQALSRDIKNRVKVLKNLPRYRIVCLVTIIEKFLQSIDYKMKHLLDPQRDFFAHFKFENAQFYILATVYVIYMD